MKTLPPHFFHAFALVVLLLSFTPIAHGEPIQAGTAVVDITPEQPARMAGYFYERFSTGTHDPLHAKALVMQQGDCRAAIVFCDLIGMPMTLSAKARTLAAEKTGIPKSNIVVAVTHSHTGPLYFGWRRDAFRQQAIAEHGHDPYEKQCYADLLAERIVQAVVEAKASLRPVEIAAGVGSEKRLSFNRRFHMTSGPVRFNPGVLNPNIVRAAGPTDPDVGLLLFRQTDSGVPIASLSVFALHLDTTSSEVKTLLSADYPYYLAESLKQIYGDSFVSFFGVGTCGDINHINFTSQKKRNTTEEIGSLLAETVKQKLGKLEPIKTPSLDVRGRVVQLPLKDISDKDIAWAKDIIDQNAKKPAPFLTLVKACTIMNLLEYQTDSLAAEVQVMRLGDDAALVSLPGEVFVDLGLEIKRRSPFATTIVYELANDAPSYIPTKKAVAEGSYETVNCRIKPGGGEMLVETAVTLLNDLKR